MISDLENTAHGTGGTDGVEQVKAKGILKKLKTYKAGQTITMLSYVLPLLSALSKAFQTKLVSKISSTLNAIVVIVSKDSSTLNAIIVIVSKDSSTLNNIYNTGPF